MSRTTFALEDGELRWLDEPGAARRTLDDADCDRLVAFAEQYRVAAEGPDSWEGILAVGRELYAWLDGGERWLEQAIDRVEGAPWRVELRVVSRNFDELETAFFDAPWETLTVDDQPLVAVPTLLYCPLRRVARPAEPAPPADGRLGLVFLAAAPEGATVLDFETEETAILDATESLGLDLVVEESGHLPFLRELLAVEARRGVSALHLSCHGLPGPPPALVTEDPEGRRLDATLDDLDAAIGSNRPALVFLSACSSAAGDPALGALTAGLARRGAPAVIGWSGPVRDREAAELAEALYRQLALRRSFASRSARWIERAISSAVRSRCSGSGATRSRFSIALRS